MWERAFVVLACGLVFPAHAQAPFQAQFQSQAAPEVEVMKTLESYQLPPVPVSAYALPKKPQRYEPIRGCADIKSPAHLQIMRLRCGSIECLMAPPLKRSEAVEPKCLLKFRPKLSQRNLEQRHIPRLSLSSCHNGHFPPDDPHPY